VSSTFPGSADIFKTIPTPTTTPTNQSDASDDTLSTRLQQHSDAISAVEAWLLANITSLTEPSGVIKAFAGTSATVPSGYLLCDGTAYSRTTYSTLYAAIGVTFGAGDGSTTFNVPDGQGRALIGAGAGSGLTNRVLASKIGEETHQLSTAELASHNHTQNAHTHADAGHAHSDTGHTHSDNGHAHGISDPGHVHGYVNAILSSPGSSVAGGTTYQAGNAATNPSGTGIGINTGFAAIATGFASIATGFASIGAVTPTNNAAGSGTAHNNIQPSLVCNWIIKT
jgi:microcystin-dependent protein